MKYRYWIWILWPSFLVACVAEGLAMTLVSADDIIVFGQAVEASHQAIYTVEFFALWGFCALSSALTYLLSPKPEQSEDNSNGLM
jgi:hypothetical protein